MYSRSFINVSKDLIISSLQISSVYIYVVSTLLAL